MKPIYIFVLLLMFSFINCKENKIVQPKIEAVLIINNQEVLKNDLVLNQIEGRWYYKNEPFNGYSVKFHKNGALWERLGFINGKREGIAKQWSNINVIRVESFYRHNRLHGIYKTWWGNGMLSEESNYVNGLLEGKQIQWYPNGEISKERNLVNGQEEGMQKAWLQNGTLYVNYEAKHGRIFGMRRANSCYKLEDEVVTKDKKI